MSKLGRLTRVDLRDAWKDESQEFTPWLAQEENIKLLGDTLGLELEVEAQEKSVGPFSADILCKDTANNTSVLIENQLEKTDHTHLGQIMTYAAGLDAVTVIWIARKITEEHRAALDWLNRITEENINFFGLEIELWKIGDSPIAPKFNIVCQPNDWSKIIKETVKKEELSETKKLQLEFWTEFRKFMEDSESSVRCQKPWPQNWMNHAIGRSGFYLSSIVSAYDSELKTYTGEIRVELTIDNESAKQYFRLLQGHREQIENEIGEELTWRNPEDKRMCRIYVRKPVDISEREAWPEMQKWLKEKLELFDKVFRPRIKNLVLEESEE